MEKQFLPYSFFSALVFSPKAPTACSLPCILKSYLVLRALEQTPVLNSSYSYPAPPPVSAVGQPVVGVLSCCDNYIGRMDSTDCDEQPHFGRDVIVSVGRRIRKERRN